MVLANMPPTPRIVVTGDFNSSPEDVPAPFVPPYQQFTQGVDILGRPLGESFFDAWTLRPGKPPGLSCCQDADLLNPWSVLSERIDLIFSRDEPNGVKANQVGNSPEDKTRSGLWPSDHAGLVVRYTF